MEQNSPNNTPSGTEVFSGSGGDQTGAGYSTQGGGLQSGEVDTYQQGTTQQQQTAAPALDQETIRTLVAETVKGVLPQTQQKQQQPQMTQEEFEKRFNIYKPTEEVIQKLLNGGPEAVQILNQIVEGTSKQSVTLANAIVQQAMEAIRQEIAPHIQFAQQARANQLRNDFFAEYPDLKENEELVRQVVLEMQVSGKKFDQQNIKKAFEEVANASRSIVAKIRGNNGAGGQGSTSTAPRKMTPVSSGGQGGAGGAGARKPTGPPGIEVFS